VRSNKECTSKCYCKESKCQNRNEESVTDFAPPATLQQSSTCRCGGKNEKLKVDIKVVGILTAKGKLNVLVSRKVLDALLVVPVTIASINTA